MELFTPGIDILVQFGSGMLGLLIGMLWTERNEMTVREIVSFLKLPVAAWIICWAIGITDLIVNVT